VTPILSVLVDMSRSYSAAVMDGAIRERAIVA